MGDGRLFLKDGRRRSVQGGGLGVEKRERRGMCFKTSDVAAFPLFLILPVSPIPILSGRMSGGGGEEWRRRRRMSDIRPLVLCFLRVREEKTHKVPLPTNFIPRNCEGICTPRRQSRNITSKHKDHPAEAVPFIQGRGFGARSFRIQWSTQKKNCFYCSCRKGEI